MDTDDKLVPKERVQTRTIGQVDGPALECADDAGKLVPHETVQPRTVWQVDVPAPEHVDDAEMLVPQEREWRNFVWHAPQHREVVPTSLSHERVQRQTAGQVGDVHGPQFRDFPPERVSERIDGVPQAVEPSDRELRLLRARERVLAEPTAVEAETEVVDDSEGTVEEFDGSVDRFELSHWRPMRLCRSYLDRGCARECRCTFAHGEQELHPPGTDMPDAVLSEEMKMWEEYPG